MRGGGAGGMHEGGFARGAGGHYMHEHGYGYEEEYGYEPQTEVRIFFSLDLVWI